LKGRQDAQAVERSGPRPQLMKQQAKAGDIVLLFADESEAPTHPHPSPGLLVSLRVQADRVKGSPYLARAWARRGADLRIEAPGQSQKIAMMGAVNFVSRELIVETSRTKRSTDVIALLERLDKIHGPKPAAAGKPATIVLDNGPVHASKATRAALAARAHWLTPEWPPKHAPELNDIERDWKTLKTHHLADKTFHDRDAPNAEIEAAVQDMNSKRKTQALVKPRISA
jgi:transposase